MKTYSLITYTPLSIADRALVTQHLNDSGIHWSMGTSPSHTMFIVRMPEESYYWFIRWLTLQTNKHWERATNTTQI